MHFDSVDENSTSEVNCAHDIETIPYEFFITKHLNRSNVQATIKFAGMHSPRLIIYESYYHSAQPEFAQMMRKAVCIFDCEIQIFINIE